MTITPKVNGNDLKSRDLASNSGAAERSLRLLSLLAQHGMPMSLADLTTRLQLPKGTVHRLCANLTASGHLIRDVDEKYFSAGPALRELALSTLSHGTLSGLRQSVLTALVADIGETCNFTTLDGTEVLYLNRVEARWPLRLTIDVGTHVPLHCTSSGKLLLAHLPKRRRDRVIDHLRLPRLTASTITDAAALRRECDEIRDLGYARDNEEFVAGLISIAVPVRDQSGKVRATVSVHAPTVRLTMTQAESRLKRLQVAAEDMSPLI